MWADAALYALGQAEANGLDKTTAAASRFRLRANVITDVGPNGDPRWDPDALGDDILRALPLTREQAATWSLTWRDRPPSEILNLRHCKNLLIAAKSIRTHLKDATITTNIDQWLAFWERLP